jgi:hypothetical protein
MNTDFSEFVRFVDEKRKNHPELRHGQTVMNLLYEFWPEKYTDVKGTDLDCFYDESKTEPLLESLKKEWN